MSKSKDLIPGFNEGSESKTISGNEYQLLCKFDMRVQNNLVFNLANNDETESLTYKVVGTICRSGRKQFEAMEETVLGPGSDVFVPINNSTAMMLYLYAKGPAEDSSIITRIEFNQRANN